MPAALRNTTLLKNTTFAALSLSVLTGLIAPGAQAQNQDLYVLDSGYDTITRFSATGNGNFATYGPTTQINATNPSGLVFDAAGNLFVSEFSATGTNVAELPKGTLPDTYGPAKTLSAPSLNQNGPAGLAFDARGNLFVANQGNSPSPGKTVTEFVAGSLPGTFEAATTLSGGGLNGPSDLAFDRSGNLFVANSVGNTITEFAAGTTPGTFGAGSSFTAPGLNYPLGLAFDALGDLFTSNYLSNTITEFASTGAGKFGSGITFAANLNGPAGLAFDNLGNLFVVNEGDHSGSNGSIVRFAFNPTMGTFGPSQTVETGLRGAEFLAFGPAGPPVPEASTTVSFGLLLALGAGGMVIAARRKKAPSAL